MFGYTVVDKQLEKLHPKWKIIMGVLSEKIDKATKRGEVSARIEINEIDCLGDHGFEMLGYDWVVYTLLAGWDGEVVDPITGEMPTNPVRIQSFIKDFFIERYGLASERFKIMVGGGEVFFEREKE